ncbi:ABC transporter ATP-binding protein [Enterococcus italicus]|uniref:ABC transporter ATP-binding protein n=1 Tax=Enterococcus italicus TaxID=246144 RepID=UPI0020736372|nr:ATP-binding cassette domain-containing protein [Enterococcus italicus]MCM6930650.1 ABC transporter ATP-binding protein [Enterococcus italicus]
MIEIKNLVKKYGNHIALDHVSFSIEKGKIYGLLGANGAGKSTTMNIITGYIGATSGSVEIDGLDNLAHPEEVKKKIGYLPEIPPLYLDMKVEEYLRFCAELKEVPKEGRKYHVNEMIEKVKLQSVCNRLIKNLSKGYRQRVGLAQALIGWPEILILDEPTVGLDPKQIIEIRQLIREFSKDRTVIFSSHILAEVQELCDDILIISKGKLIVNETKEELERSRHTSVILKLEVKGTPQEVEDVMDREFSQLTYQLTETAKQSCKLSVTVSNDNDEREAFFFAFINAKLPILEMHQSTANLEEVFLEIMQETTSDKLVNESEEEQNA